MSFGSQRQHKIVGALYSWTLVYSNVLVSIDCRSGREENNESSEVFDIIRPRRKVQNKRLQAVKCQQLLTICFSRAGGRELLVLWLRSSFRMQSVIDNCTEQRYCRQTDSGGFRVTVHSKLRSLLRPVIPSFGFAMYLAACNNMVMQHDQ